MIGRVIDFIQTLILLICIQFDYVELGFGQDYSQVGHR
jgi:hypothetical protein